jgi:hypothetical protein
VAAGLVQQQYDAAVAQQFEQAQAAAQQFEQAQAQAAVQQQLEAQQQLVRSLALGQPALCQAPAPMQHQSRRLLD